MYSNIRDFLDAQVARFNTPAFIPSDPISIPHLFSKPQDIEISAFWTAMLSWGQRKTILDKARLLFSLMDFAPHDFIVHHQENDRKRFLSFKHRTFQPVDALYFLDFFQQYYREHTTLEYAFSRFMSADTPHVEPALIGFNTLFFSHEYSPDRTRKHVPTPARGSTCKRLNMFLRWMVRHDQSGVDFGLWKNITPAQLLIPLDVHVERTARHIGLLSGTTVNWNTVIELTQLLRTFDKNDPVKYDYALFGLGVLDTKER